VRAVFGNVDDPQDPQLEAGFELEADGITIHVSHGHELGSPTPEKLLARYTADVLVAGHTHRGLIHRVGDRIVINPGAAGPRRFNIRPSVAILRIEHRRVEAEIVWL
jgi:putative phosphoesterase